jgi:hypothetical protein
MDLEKLMQAAHTLSAVQGAFNELSERNRTQNVATACANLAQVHAMLVDLSMQMFLGRDPGEALQHAASSAGKE